MNVHIKKLLNSIVSENPSDEAVHQLALIIERSNHIMKNKQKYRVNLSPTLLKISLTIKQQEEIATSLLNHLNRDMVNPSLLWIIGKVHPIVLVEIIQIWILEHYQRLDAKMLYQSLAALQNIFVYEYPEDYSVLSPKLRHSDLLAMVSILSNSDDVNVSHQADNFRQSLEWYIVNVLKTSEDH